jgi:hypothetical protein
MLTVSHVAALARRAAMSSSYKPALLKALVRIAPTTTDVEISFDRLGAEFLRLYWTQTVVFRLRQAPSLAKEPEVVQEIRRVAAKNRVRHLRDLPIAERTKLESRLARVLPINVIDAFHVSKPAAMPPLFARGMKNNIRLTADAQAFVRENAGALQAIANLWWASYLEKVNQLAPLIIQKVERDGARRASVAKYLELLRSVDGTRCFYCERTVFGAVKGHVDHVIPWSFMLSDPLWDLVLACERCNLEKSDVLPHRDYLKKLATRHVQRAKVAIPPGFGSILLAADEVERYYDAALGVEWPAGWVPFVEGPFSHPS